MFGINFDLKFSSQPRRHTDSVKSRDSICTVANQHSSHFYFLRRERRKITVTSRCSRHQYRSDKCRRGHSPAFAGFALTANNRVASSTAYQQRFWCWTKRSKQGSPTSKETAYRWRLNREMRSFKTYDPIITSSARLGYFEPLASGEY